MIKIKSISDEKSSEYIDTKILLGHLPNLPNIVRYYDKFEESNRTIENFRDIFSMMLRVSGRNHHIRFGYLDAPRTEILKHVIMYWVGAIDPRTMITHLTNLQNCKKTFEFIGVAVSCDPADLRSWWVEHCLPFMTQRKLSAFKSILRGFCHLAIGPWSKAYLDFASRLPEPPKNRYDAVDAGFCFLPIEHQAMITDWLDDISAQVTAEPFAVPIKQLREACGLGISYQLGLRAVQIASIEIADVSVRSGRVYVRILMAKQKNQTPSYVVRRLKPEWASAWIELARRHAAKERVPGLHPDKFLGLSPERVTLELAVTTQRLTSKRWTPHDLRHTGAQRLADAGASHEELQDYLMHATDAAANVYFGASAAQAAKVNQAMGLSQIYREVAAMAREAMITKEELASLPEDQQIGGVPHGIPVAGIGSCQIGQSHCVKNPVLSCYGCRKFLPVGDPTIHLEVADGLRGVVKAFYKVGSDADASPAYGQLRRTIEAADREALKAQQSDEVRL